MTNLSERAKKAAEIAKKPHLFKVCEGCESIVVESASTCPNCHGYRFDSQAERVIEQAKILGSRPQNSVRPDDLFN